MLSDDKWNELLNGPLYHPLIMFITSRRLMALRFVVAATGEAGEKALREHCHIPPDGKVQFSLKALSGVLRCVVEATGEEGENALLEHCRCRQQRDEAQ